MGGRRRRHRHAGIRWTFAVMGPVVFKWEDEPVIEISNEQIQKKVQRQAVTMMGAKAPVDGVPTCVSSDETICKVENFLWDPENSIAQFDIVSVDGAVGVAQVVLSADADLGDGVTPITNSIAVSVVAAGAVGFNGLSDGETTSK